MHKDNLYNSSDMILHMLTLILRFKCLSAHSLINLQHVDAADARIEPKFIHTYMVPKFVRVSHSNYIAII